MILIITTHPIQYQVPLWKKLTEAGIDLEVIFLTKQGLEDTFDPGFGQTFKWDIDLLAGYTYSFAEVNLKADVSSFLKVRLRESLKSLIKNKKIDAIWIQGWQVFAYWQIAIQAKLLGIPVWLRGESNDLRPINKVKNVIKYLPMKGFFNCISRFLYIGESNKRYYLNWGIKKAQLGFTPYCVDIDRFKKDAANLKHKKSILREKWGIAPDACCFIFSGKFVHKKHPDIIIKAAECLRTEYPNLHLLFVGDGELRSELISQTHVKHCPDNFEKDKISLHKKVKASFTGFLNQNEISEAYVAADCLILPSDYGETWGLVVNDAYAHNLPAIVSNRCGCQEDLVNPVDVSLIFDYGSVESLARSMKQILTEMRNYSQAIQVLNSKYCYSTIVKSIQEIRL